MMRTCLLFYLALSFAGFGFGMSLQCYNCSFGVSDSCEDTVQCMSQEDSCLKLISGEKTYTSCIKYSDCDVMILASKYPVPGFTFSCCQSDLCNTEIKTWLQKLKDFFG
ncbi:CD59 glycoprotein-like [Thalassophryne amazonica]|uniref:CD59 glycoprotein-like n=1 Tax=Thalassophryne amazonica TaxID=390379 RepID=UPI0014714B67|nr:CD59 glycoprotein-like [Thalassophryne amazonica]